MDARAGRSRSCWASCTILAGVLPSGVAWVGARIVDSVVEATRSARRRRRRGHHAGALVGAGRGVDPGGHHRRAPRHHAVHSRCSRPSSRNRVNVMILEKALTLELTHFEDSEFYDKLTRARREASSRPLSLVMRTSGLFQNAIAIASFAVLLAGFSPWAVVVLHLRRPAGVLRRDQVLGRRVPAVPLARARDAHADLSRNRAGARGPRQGGQAVRPRQAVPRPLQGDLRRAVREGPQSHDPPRRLGLRVHAGEHRRAVQRLRVVRGRGGARRSSRSAR